MEPICGRLHFCGVEVWRGSLCGAYRLPTLSSVGASLATPCFRFHTPLIEPGRADLPHTTLGEDSCNHHCHCMCRCLQRLKTTWELWGLSPNSFFLHRFLRPHSTVASSLHRSYPASSVPRASLPSQSALPLSHEPPVDSSCHHRWEFPTRPCPKSRRVGSCISLFEACSALTHVTPCVLTESPMRPSTAKASAASSSPPLLRLLPGELVSSREVSAGDHHVFTAHPVIALGNITNRYYKGASPDKSKYTRKDNRGFIQPPSPSLSRREIVEA